MKSSKKNENQKKKIPKMCREEIKIENNTKIQMDRFHSMGKLKFSIKTPNLHSVWVFSIAFKFASKTDYVNRFRLRSTIDIVFDGPIDKIRFCIKFAF